MTNCYYDRTSPPPAPTTTTFPCLEVLRLRRCVVTLQRLQDMVIASPRLAALQLEASNVTISTFSYNYRQSHLAQRFCCPGLTTLVILNCFTHQNDVPIELDVLRVPHFKYRGNMSQFTLRSPLQHVRKVYLHILDCNRSNKAMKCESFWSFLKNVRCTKVLKLKLEWPIDDVAVLERRRMEELLILGQNQSTQSVEQLEVHAPHNPGSKDVGLAIGNLLQYCPALRDLRLKLHSTRDLRNQITFPQSDAQLEFYKSIDHFRHRRDRPVVPLSGDDIKFEVSHIPGLSDRWFHLRCLQFHLKRLSLQFHMDKGNPNCVGIRLAKFFVERGMALEEMYIDDGNMKLWEHMNCKISGYAANPQPFSEGHVLARMSQALSMNQFSSSSNISGWFHPHKLEVSRTNPCSTSRSFTILPLADR